MATSKVEIVNVAIAFLGSDPITEITEATNRARTANALFDGVRDAVLRAFPWNFATKRANLPSALPAPTYGWSYSIPLPADCLRLLSVEAGQDYDVEGRRIVSNASSLNVTYTAKITDVTLYDSLFCQALGARLAHAMSKRVTDSDAGRDDLWEIYKAFVREARSIDSQEGRATQVDASTWTDARVLGTTGYTQRPYA
jgi:hypothetical protein